MSTAAASHVFTYGTLMFPEVWRIVTGREERGIAGNIPGHNVFRVRDGVYPGMIWTGGASIVSGVVYRNVDVAAIERLDEFEGSAYERRTVLATCADGETHECFAYVVPPHQHHLLTREPWTAQRFAARGDLARFLNSFQGFSRLHERRRELAS
jgi:gamma-glutamylcyclotransferase (GGCT)/AIG2-like uncharacterized protein YtfP